jgi:ubiquitin-protein ligase
MTTSTTSSTTPPPPRSDSSIDLDGHSNDDMDPASSTNTEDYLRWKYCMKSISRCEATAGIRDTSVYGSVKKLAPSEARPHTCMKRLVRELSSLRRTLPGEPNSSIWIRFDEDTPQFMRALMTAPDGTPYSGGLFCFDIWVPNDYPLRPPHMTLLTTGRGSIRFGPNLYADGTICLSLLGSWNGPQWNPLSSNLFQLLVSVQSLILGVEQPYYLEPGRGGWEGTVRSTTTTETKKKEGQKPTSMIEVERWMRGKVVRSLPYHVRRYNSFLTCATVQWAMLDHLRRGPCSIHHQMVGFQEAIRAHFWCNGAAICNNLRRMCDETPWRERTLRLNSLKNVLLPELEALIQSIPTPESLAGFDFHDKEMMKELMSGPAGGKKDINHSLNGVAFQVTIPEPVQPGGLFCVSAAEQKVMLRCPDDAGPGMSVFFRLHIEEDGQYHFEMLPLVVKASPAPTFESGPVEEEEEESGSDGETPSSTKDESSSSSKHQKTSAKGKASSIDGKGKKLAKFFSSFRSKKSSQQQAKSPSSSFRKNDTNQHEEVYV